jgi:hypothetical protein
MPATVCTLFENRYHLGVAVLVNSLARAGYAGEVHAGFRGPLPPWANDATQRDATTWEFPVTPQLRILFIRLQTTAHFANYKPDLILQTLAKTDADAVLYFDPDVVVNTTWRYIEEWLSCGVALCDDVNSPLPENHPRRIGWRRFFRTQGQELRFRGAPYANSGVVGVPRIHSSLLEVWRGMQTAASASLGGPDVVRLRRLFSPTGPGHTQRGTRSLPGHPGQFSRTPGHGLRRRHALFSPCDRYEEALESSLCARGPERKTARARGQNLLEPCRQSAASVLRAPRRGHPSLPHHRRGPRPFDPPLVTGELLPTQIRSVQKELFLRKLQLISLA